MPGFGEYSIEQLMAMVANFSPETVESRGTALVKAAGDIKAIGEILKSHKVSGWEGDASTAFQEWVSQAGSATLRLSEYSATGGKYMVEAGQTMREVRRDMPKRGDVDPELSNYAAAKKFHNDPDAQPVARAAWAKLEQHRMAAAQQLEKLATSYKQSAYQMNTAEIPTFPPPPANFVPQGDNGSTYIARSGGGSETAGDSGGSFHGPQVAPGASSSKFDVLTGRSPESNDTLAVPSTTGPTGAPVSAIPDLDLNHVGTLPEKSLPQAPVGAGPVGPGGATAAHGGAIPFVPVPPVEVAKPGGGLGAVGGGKLPGIGGLTGRAGAVAGFPPRDAGIVGGRPVSGVGPGAGIPRGTVIGAEGGQTAGRGVMGGGMGGGAGGTHGASGGSAVGRRLATEPGGVVGGRPPVSGGRSITGGQSFTQGGSGLVRGVEKAGSVNRAGHGAAGAQGPGRRRDGQGGKRPEYLAEDEETWQANRRVVPPVID